MEVKCGIYKYTNLINGKVYIGQSTNILKREKYHYGSMCNKKDKRYYTYFYSSMRKYGYDNFKFEILELCSKEELNKKERYYIKLYNANNHKFGYNLTDGGVEGEHYTRNIYQIDMNNGNIIKTFNSVKEANDLYKTSNIGFCCKTKKNSIKGYLWRYVDEYDIEEVKETIDKRKHRNKTEKEKMEKESSY